MVIDSFKNEYDFLSNFYEREFTIGDVTVKSVEHGYQAAKAGDNIEWREKILNAATPGIAKKLGKKVPLPENWENEKIKYMIVLVDTKFQQNPDLMDKLVATGDAELIEGNWWGDTFWGVCNGEGQNYLGRILMSVRDLEISKRNKNG